MNQMLTLNNGVKIPILGLGTYQATDKDVLTSTLQTALELGYRHFDTAAFYHNEAQIGSTFKKLLTETDLSHSIKRSDLFITSKLWPSNFETEKALRSFHTSLSDLQLEYIDLFLLHWPHKLNKEVWKVLEKLYKEGYVRAIGVSNFTTFHLSDLLDSAEILPAVNQIECHPHLVDYELLDFCKTHNIIVESWSPFMRGAIFKDATLLELGDKYHKSVAQIVLRWNLQLGLIPLPKSITPSRIKENLEIFDFELTSEDMERIASLNDHSRTGFDPNEVYLNPEIIIN